MPYCLCISAAVRPGQTGSPMRQHAPASMLTGVCQERRDDPRWVMTKLRHVHQGHMR